MQFFSFVDRYNGDVHRAGIAFSSWQLVFDAICEILPAMLRNVIGLYLIVITRRELVTNLQFNSTVGRNGTGMELELPTSSIPVPERNWNLWNFRSRLEKEWNYR